MNSRNTKAAKGEKATPVLPAFGLATDLLAETSSDKRPGADRLSPFVEEISRQDKRNADKPEEEQFETWVTFLLAAECFGLPVSQVQEILRVSTITRVPDAPHPVRGVIDMRGTVLPVVDLRVRLGLPDKDIDALSRILVVSSQARRMGMLVDCVKHVLRLTQNKVQPPPADVMTARSDYIIGVYHLQDMLAILLDVDRLLYLRS